MANQTDKSETGYIPPSEGRLKVLMSDEAWFREEIEMLYRRAMRYRHNLESEFPAEAPECIVAYGLFVCMLEAAMEAVVESTTQPNIKALIAANAKLKALIADAEKPTSPSN